MATSPEPLAEDLFPGLSERQRQSIPVVVAGPTVAAGLQAAEVPRTTWYRWMKEPAVGAAVKGLQSAAMLESLGDLQGGTRYAVTGLLGLMASKNEHVKLQACRDVLTFAMRGAELIELSDRLARIEDALSPLIEAADL